LIFSALQRFFSKPSCPEDKLKLRWNRPIGKGDKSDLSTFRRIACGGEWTTQPLIAFGGFWFEASMP